MLLTLAIFPPGWQLVQRHYWFIDNSERSYKRADIFI